MKTITIIIFSTMIFLSCSSSKNDNKLKFLSNDIDSNELMNVFENHILKKLDGQHIRKTKIRNDGSRFIEFFEDTTRVDPSDIFWEFYRFDQKSLVIGDLNNDKTFDFAIKTTNGVLWDNRSTDKWHVFVSDGEKWKSIENSFGQHFMKHRENVVKIENEFLITEFEILDIDKISIRNPEENKVTKEYRLTNNKLKLIK